MTIGFARPRPQQSSQHSGSGTSSKPSNPNPVSGSAFSSVIGGREDRGLRKNFGNNIARTFVVFILSDDSTQNAFTFL